MFKNRQLSYTILELLGVNLPHFIVTKEKTKIIGTFVHCFIRFERRVLKEYINFSSPPPLNPYDSTVQAAAYTIA